MAGKSEVDCLEGETQLAPLEVKEGFERVTGDSNFLREAGPVHKVGKE